MCAAYPGAITWRTIVKEFGLTACLACAQRVCSDENSLPYLRRICQYKYLIKLDKKIYKLDILILYNVVSKFVDKIYYLIL